MISTQYAVKINYFDPANDNNQTGAKVKYHNNQTPTADNALLGFFNYIHLTPHLEALAKQAQPDTQAFMDETFKQLSDQCIDSAKAKVSQLHSTWTDNKAHVAPHTLKFHGQTSPVEINHGNFQADQKVFEDANTVETLGWTVRIRNTQEHTAQQLATHFDHQVKPRVQECIAQQLREGNALELGAQAVQAVIKESLPTNLIPAGTEVQVKLKRDQLLSNTKVVISAKNII